MLALVFDTETTGIYQRRLPPNHPSQPDVVQVCGWLADEEKVYSTFNVFVHADTPIPKDAYETHRIDREMTGRVGVSRRTACHIFNGFARKADVIVGHNVEFDINMMRTAMQREGGRAHVLAKPSFCTMKSSTDICKIPHPQPERFPNEFKWPNLTEAYCQLVDPRGFDDAHDAEADVRACYEVYRVLRKNPDGR